MAEKTLDELREEMSAYKDAFDYHQRNLEVDRLVADRVCIRTGEVTCSALEIAIAACEAGIRDRVCEIMERTKGMGTYRAGTPRPDPDPSRPWIIEEWEEHNELARHKAAMKHSTGRSGGT